VVIGDESHCLVPPFRGKRLVSLLKGSQLVTATAALGHNMTDLAIRCWNEIMAHPVVEVAVLGAGRFEREGPDLPVLVADLQEVATFNGIELLATSLVRHA